MSHVPRYALAKDCLTWLVAFYRRQLEDALDALDALKGIREAETEGTISLEELRARLGRSAIDELGG